MNRRRRLTGLLLLGVGVLWVAGPDSPTSTQDMPADRPQAQLPTRTAPLVGGERGAQSTPAVVSAAIVAPSVLLADLQGLDTEASWVPNQLLVSGTDPALLVELAEQHGLQLALGRSVQSMGVLRAPPGTDLAALRDTILSTPGVGTVERNGIVRGAATGLTAATIVAVPADDTSPTAADAPTSYADADGATRTTADPTEGAPTADTTEPTKTGGAETAPTDGAVDTAPEEPPPLTSLQWHLDAIGIGLLRSPLIGVAVLDSGMAYRTARVQSSQLGWIDTVTAPSLRDVMHYDPWDFVEGDAFPDDEHWHGTHISSVIAGTGSLHGTGSGVVVLPYRVLDADNVGLEFFLVDAIASAVEVGAQVVNMSLSFGPDYMPSLALETQLEAAADAGVLMIAAAGNNADVGSTWPAASNHVISVGSTCAVNDLHLAPYSNRGGDVDLYAPGGCNHLDEDLNGYPDGILGEAFPKQHPDQVAPYWVQGTSQAAAVASGVIAHAVAAGVPADKALALFQLGGDAFDDLAGGGSSLNINGAAAQLASMPSTPPELRVAMLPWIEQDGAELVPRLNLMVLDADGLPVHGVGVRGVFKGTTNSAFSCTTDQGVCGVSGDGVADTDAVGWTVQVNRIRTLAGPVAPHGVLLANGALDLAYLEAWTALDDAPPLGFELLEDSLPGAAHAYSFPLMGSGISTSPFGVVVTEPFLDDLGAPIDRGMGGSGISTSPFGWTGIGLPGSGTQPKLVTVEGSGISTSPFGVLLKGSDTPPDCLGAPGCPVSVVDPVQQTVAGDLSGSSASLQMLVKAGDELGLSGSAALFDGMGEPTKLEGQSDMAVPLVVD